MIDHIEGGGALTVADLVLFPIVQGLLRAAGKDAAVELNLGLLPLAETYENVDRWVRDVEALPNYERTYPPHWRG